MYIKLPIEVANTITRIPEDLVPEGYTLPEYEDAREFLIWQDIGEYTYIFAGLFTLPNKNRDRRLFSDEVWDEIETNFSVFASQNGFEVVETLPEQEVL